VEQSGSISLTCLPTAFRYTNALAFNFYFTNNTTPNFTSTIEGSNIKYGKIKNCKIDTNLTSKIWRRVISKKNDGNIEFIIDLFNIDSKNGVKRGPPADDDRGCYDPV